MHDRIPLNDPAPSADPAPPCAIDLVRQQARRLHRAAQSPQVLLALPAVRRVHAAGLFPGRALSALYRERTTLLQRKHFLRTLAVEAGYADWERFRPALEHLPPEAFEHFQLLGIEQVGRFKLWFSTEAEAQVHAAAHGGRVLRYGSQAAVLPLEAGVGA
ncbi:hypothetical protein [Ideonella sp. A 288]|uniref:hypothetical protein n=1 Tax=Ideonella sp. A 288 TaxID=1962181 RepID=UPI0018FEC0B5|nr:hypothetical protein [Ideonella sp. A 288]